MTLSQNTVPAAADELTASIPVPGRECGSCTLCCKVYDAPVLAKLDGVWCRHCKPGRGCSIWDTRPEHCRAFQCLWTTQAWIGPEWKPERSKIVLTLDPATRFLFAKVDPGSPKAWRAEPFRSQLKAWADAAAPRDRLVVVFVNKRGTVILPGRPTGQDELDIGAMGPGDRLMIDRRLTAHGRLVDVRKVSASP